MSSLGYSEIDTQDNLENKYNNRLQTKEGILKKKKTYKKKRQPIRNKNKITGEKVESFLNLMKDVGNNDSSDGSGLADFNPPPKPVLTKQPDEVVEDDSINQNDFNSLDDYAANEKYYNQYIPYYTEAQNQPKMLDNKDKLFEKLNYVIHLLEEEKDSKTNNVTEELVLYMFLGVFVIFIVDSFARVSKYTR
tara:strand:- start:500 stop:1075 length:576 start_codon:yes stop_codon:yes gene_type:complete